MRGWKFVQTKEPMGFFERRRIMRRIKRSGSLREAERLFDAMDRGEDVFCDHRSVEEIHRSIDKMLTDVTDGHRPTET